MNIEIREFAEVMQVVERSMDEAKGTNSWRSRSVEDLARELENYTTALRARLQEKDMVHAKANAVHIANLSRMIWSKL